MRELFRHVSCLCLISGASLFAQGPTLTGSGYSNTSIVRVAPGQITTLFVTGLKTVLPSEPTQTAGVPLPTSLAGISLTLNQPGQQPFSLPLLSLQQLSTCSDGGGSSSSASATDCLITAITVQFPFELLLPPRGVSAELTVKENGNTSSAFKVFPVSANLHILNGCDAFPKGRLNTCDGVVTHADGTPVTSDSPAKAGEAVVIYAFGLGQTTPAVKTGDATPTPAPNLVGTTVAVQFDSRPNAMPSNPYINPNFPGIPSPIVPMFVGLTPGQVGLYQINVKIPDTLPSVVPCSSSLGVASNLTIDVGSSTSGGLSFDGAPICVQAQQ